MRTEHDALWTVTCAEYPRGLVRVRRRSGLTQVVVADRGEVGAPAPDSFAAAACTRDGELLLSLRAAPPAIVVGAADLRTRPADGGGHDSEFPGPGQRLILLSCAAFEAAPTLLATGGDPTQDLLGTEDPERLLLALLGAGGRGAGTVIDRHVDPDPEADLPTNGSAAERDR
ncbi:hypothetical protein [Phycicoccus avicenniae]|uniref:hypothetical protein n=1 Tax=Phycicoccus avicenniae TaxID=2828860 RepID=UPI003D286981